jgi:ATP/maltotriose-dependent transcriptional regulator MalT
LQGQLPRARKLADESLQLAEVSGDRHLAVAISIRMALAYLDAGEMAVAKRWLSTAVTRAGDVGNSSLLAWALADWARAAWAAGFPDEAKTAASRSLPLALDQQDWARASQLSGLLGDMALSAGEGEDAARRYRQARDYAERSDEPQVLAMVNREAAARALRCGQTAQAQLLLDQARAGLQTATPDGQQSLLARERVLLELQAAELAIAQARFDQGDGFLRAAERGLDARSERNLRVKLSLIDARRLYLSGDSAAAQLRLQELGDLRAAGLERSALARDSLLRAIADDDRQKVAAIAAIEPSLCAEAADVNPRAQAAPDPARGNRQPDQDADERSEPNRINRD